MKLTKRIASLLLSLVLLVSLACTGVWVPHAHAEAEEVALDDLQIVHINPLYANTVTEDDLVEPERPSLYADNTDGKYYYDAKTAGEMIRDDLVARDTTIVVDAYCKISSMDNLNQDAKDLAYAVMDAAMAHTGNPVEGDYLLWQYAGFQTNMTNAQQNGTNIYATITYTMTYHSSAEQEVEMDAAVDKLLGQLNVSEADDYGKLEAIYDYITANVTYDRSSDDNYKLKHTAYAALINKTAVCQGYATLLYRLALELGVDCRLIAGTSRNQNHGWNIAKVGDSYYNLDSTWDAGEAEYQYFLVSSKNFPDHARWDDYNTAEFHAAYPMAEYNYTIDCTHSYESAVTTKPTCTEKGIETFTCILCGYAYTEALPSTGHNYDKSEVTAPTCTEKGFTTHTCSGCGDSYQNTYVDATGHSYDEGVVTTAPTCTAVGVKTYTCAACKGTYTEDVPMVDHVYNQSQVTAPTCTEQGYTTHTCVCGDFYRNNFVDATGHTYDQTEVTPPTCTEDGYTTHTCACGDFYQNDFVDATGHSYDEGVVTTAPTCYDAGVKTFTCTVCGVSYTETIAATGHNYDQIEVTPPTCIDDGYTTYTCACGDSYQDAPVAATGHSYDAGIITKEATCSEEGVKLYTCAVCGDTYEEAIAALGHAYDDGKVTKEATCTDYGAMVHTCARCDSTINAYVDPLGHAYDEGTVTLAPTCTEDGTIFYTCTVCDYTYEDVLPALGHNFVDNLCTGCDAKSVAITAQPKTAYAKMGEVAVATVEAEGDGLQYQWYIRNAKQKTYSASSITAPTYAVTMSEKTKERRAYCIITDAYGNTQQSKTIVIREAASIVAEPEDVCVKVGENAVVSTAAIGDELTYQWYYKDAGKTKFSKSSITTDTYTVEMTKERHGRQLYCVVKDQHGKKAQTETVTLRAAASVITEPKTAYAKSGEVAKVTMEAVGEGLTYQWYFRNANKTSYSKSSVTGATYSCKVTNTSKDRSVYCVITDAFGNTVQTEPVMIRMAATITEQPESVKVNKGQNATVSVEAVGDGLTYQWYYKEKNKEKFSKSSITTDTYTVEMNKQRNGRQVYCVVKDQYGKTVKSDIVTISMK